MDESYHACDCIILQIERADHEGYLLVAKRLLTDTNDPRNPDRLLC